MLATCHSTVRRSHRPLMINLISRPGPPRIFLATFPGLNMVFPQLRCPFQATRRRNLGLGQADGRDTSTTAAIIFNAPDLSGTGGLWRSAVRGMPDAHRPTIRRQLGLEAVSSPLLSATLVYLDFAPQIAWNHVNYLY